ncbi:MAG: alpha/beta hydrolase [Steroidobacteraceae bacterium]
MKFKTMLATMAFCAGLVALTAAPAISKSRPPGSGAVPTAQNQAVLDGLKSLGAKPFYTLPPPQARMQPSFADGVKQALRAMGKSPTPAPGVDIRDIQLRGAAGMLHARVYRPSGVNSPLPMIVYFHGGGWVIADGNVYDASPRALVRETHAMVISVDYRRAPEARFPAQHDDALASYRWTLANAGALNGDAKHIAIAGESAGGNLAVATAIAARDAKLPMPLHILSVYPIAGSNLNTASYAENSNAKPLNRAGMAWFFRYVVRSPRDLADPRINLVTANLRGLPPTTIIAAQIDPLRSEGLILAQRLKAAGVQVERREYAGVTHEFFGADALIPQARQAQEFAGARLGKALGK